MNLKKLFSIFICSMLLVSNTFALAPTHLNSIFDDTFGLSDEWIPSPLEFPNPGTDKKDGKYYSRWVNDRLAMQLVLRMFSKELEGNVYEGLPKIKMDVLYEGVESFFKQFGRQINKSEFAEILYKFNRKAVLILDNDEIALMISPKVLAVWADDVQFIKEDLKAAVKNGKPSIIKLLEVYGKAVSLQKINPIETRYGFQRAVSYLNEKELKVLSETIASLRDKPDYSIPLINALDIRLNAESIPNFVKKVTPNLDGREIIDISPEFSEVAGGLGRVQQYHVTGMFSLGAFIKALESKYQIFKNVRGKIFGGTVPENIPADYSNDASYPVKIDETKVFESEILFKDKNVRIKVEEGINSEGVSVLLITDLPDQNGQYPLGKSYFKRMFKYAQNAEEEKEFPQMIEFSTFMGKASWEYVKNKYREEWKKDKKNWKAPVVNVNDAQTILVPVYRAVDYYGALNEARKAQKEERWEDAKNWLEEAEYLRSFFISATTHTYRNKGFFGFYSEWFRNKLIESGIPEEFHVYFASNAPEGTELPMAGNVNLTSAGLKLADCAKAVAGLHAHEVWEYDTVLEKLHGVTNGDIIRNSTKYFRQYLEKINPKAFKKNPDYYKSPSADDVSRTKKEAKKELKSIQHNGDELEINPEQLVVSYSGRWVEEKRSSRAFNFINIRDGHRYLNLDPSTNNIIKLVEQGVQVVIFGNVQDYDKELGELGKAMEAYINKLIKEDPKKYTGKFIFKDKFNLEEQLKLLAASDIQIQDSDRSTGASEYTESNATANGAINMGSPYHEGVINKHGELMNFLKEGVGNSIVPVNEDPDSYYDQIINVNKLFKQGRLKFWQATSIKESQILEAIQTSAEYLRIWNSYFDVDSSTGKANYLSRTIPKPISLNYEGANNAEAAFNNTLEPVKIKWSWIKSANSEGEETIHNYNTSDWSFDATSKDNLTLYVELEEFKDDYNYGADYFIYLRGTDGKKFPVNAMFDKEKRRFSFDIPKYFSGKYELFLATPAKAFKFPQRILIREPKVEVPQIVEKKITNDSTVYIIRFPKDMGSDYHMTLSIPGLKPWESVFPGDILFNGRDLKHVADSRAELPGTVKRTLKPSSNARVNAYELVLTIPNGINATDLLIAPVKPANDKWKLNYGDSFTVNLIPPVIIKPSEFDVGNTERNIAA